MFLSLYQIFIFLLGHLHFFLHFFFTFMENLFKKHPISSFYYVIFSGSSGSLPSTTFSLRISISQKETNDNNHRYGPSPFALPFSISKREKRFVLNSIIRSQISFSIFIIVFFSMPLFFFAQKLDFFFGKFDS